MTYLLIGGLAVLLGIAGLAVWRAFQDPVFYARAIQAVVSALLPAILKRKSPEEEARWRDEQLTGVKPDRTDDTPKRGNWKGS